MAATARALPESSPAFEHHYTPAELAKVWQVSPDSIIRKFKNVPGVVKIASGSRVMLRIPASVAEREHRKMSQ